MIIIIQKEQVTNLKNEFKIKSAFNNKRIYIIKNAENLNKSSANTMLKFLEEPEDNIIALLITNNKTKVLETISINIYKGKNTKSNLAWGVDFNHHWKNWFSRYEDIFPLQEIMFENIAFPCINNIEGYLQKVYGNYMSYPKKLGYGHSMFAKLSEEEKAVIKSLVEL